MFLLLSENLYFLSGVFRTLIFNVVIDVVILNLVSLWWTMATLVVSVM